MAASMFDTFMEFNDVISCVWCKKRNLTELVQLGCFHLSCKVCLQRKLEDPRPGTEFNCPECDMSCIVPTGGVDKFPDEPLLHKMNQITTIFSDDKPNCRLCEQVNVVSSTSSACITCKIYLCERDAKCHQVTPGHKLKIYLCERDAKCHQVTPGHKVIPHEELCVEPNLSLMLKSKTKTCEEHSSEMIYFCNKCQHEICTECGMLNHSDHNKDLVKNIATEYRKILDDKVVELKKIKAKENMQIINNEENSKNLRVNFEITELKDKIKRCENAISYITVFLKFSSDSDVIHRCRKIISNLKRSQITDYRGACSLSDQMQGLGLNEGIESKKVCGFELEAKWQADLYYPGLSVCQDEFLLVCGQTMKWFNMDGKCKREIKSVDIGDAWGVDVCENEVYISDREKGAVLWFDREGNMKRRLYLPMQTKDELYLAVDRVTKDIYVCTSGSNMIYKCDIRSLHFEPWITDGLNSPQYICVTLDHHLVVSNYTSHTVEKYNPKGKLVWRYGSLGHGKGQLNEPFGVCSDPSGHIFIADHYNHRVVVVSRNGDHLFEVDIGEKFMKPEAVSFGNGRLAIASYGQDPKIYVIKVEYS